MFKALKQTLWGVLLGALIATQALGQATLLPNAKQQFFTAQGIPAASGTVDMYVPSTTTRKTTWKSSSETVGNQNTNPILLDAGGFAVIYGDGQYRQIVKDADGNTIWDAVTASTGGGSTPVTPTVGDGNIVGTVLPWSGLIAPPNYLFAYGEVINRADYPLFFTTVTITTPLICTSGLNVLSGLSTSNTQNIRIGAPVEASCIPPGTTVTAVSANSVTISANASVSTAINAIFFPYGNGNGSSTFNVPDLRGQFLAGRNNMGGTARTGTSSLSSLGYGTSPNALGAASTTGEQFQLTLNSLPPGITSANTGSIPLTVTTTNTNIVDAPSGLTSSNAAGGANSQIVGLSASAGARGSTGTLGVGAVTVTSNVGINAPISRVPTATTINYIVKVLPDVSSVVATGVASLGGMTGVIACGSGLTCAANTISLNTGAPLTLGTANSITALRAFTPGAYDSVNLLSYYGDGLGGGGFFLWNAASTTADNSGTVIQPLAGGTGRWVRQPPNRSTYTPEMFGAHRDGTDDQTFVNATIIALGALTNKGTLEFSCNSTYTVSSYSAVNPISLINPLTGVNIKGCGNSSVIKVGDNVNTSLKFANVIYAASTVSNVTWSDFTIDFNGALNSCSQTCWQSNAGVGMYNGDSITFKNIKFINNPGSNDVVVGTNAEPPTVTNLALLNLIHEHSGDIVNSASADFSAEFFIANGVVATGGRFSDGPRTNGTAIEAHGTNIVVSDAAITDYFNCVIVANLPASPLVRDVIVDNVACRNVHSGMSVFSFAASVVTNVTFSNSIIEFKTGDQGNGIDACSNIDPATGVLTNLSVLNNIVKSDVTTNLGNDASGIWACRWLTANVQGNQTFNTQGPGVRFTTSVNNASLVASNNQINNPGKGSTTGLQAGVVAEATGGVTTDVIGVLNNQVKGIVRYSVIGAQNSTGGLVVGNIAPLASIAPTNWTGTGTLVIPTFVTTVNGTACTLGTTCTIVAAATSVAIGTTTISGGTSGRVIYDNAGVLGEYTTAQLTAQINAATTSLSGAVPAWPGNTTTFFRGDGTYAAVAASSLTGVGAGCLTWFATPTSANFAACITDETGTAGKVVFDTNPTFPAGITVTNNVSAGTVQNVAITNPGSTATLTLGSAKTVTISNTLTFAGTDGTTMTFPTTTATIARTDAAQTFTGTQTFGTIAPTTVNAFTLAGTIAGGGNQINNVIIGTTTPLAGNFTTLVTSTSETVPLVIGGTAVGSSLTLKSTSGVGTTDFIDFLVGNNGATRAARMLDSGCVAIGTTTDCGAGHLAVGGVNSSVYILNLVGSSAASASTMKMVATDDTVSGATGIDVTNNTGGIDILFQANAPSRSTTRWGLTIGNWAEFGDFGSGGNGLIIGEFNNKPIVFGQNNLERMRLQAGLGVGTTTDPGAGSITMTGAVQARGTVPVGTTGSCVASSFTGGATAGRFAAAVCTAGTIILSSLPTAPNGYTCTAQDQTTSADTLKQTANTTTSVTFTATTVAADVIAFQCMAW